MLFLLGFVLEIEFTSPDSSHLRFRADVGVFCELAELGVGKRVVVVE